MERDKLARTIAEMLAEAEKEEFSYPMHVTVELANGRRITAVVYVEQTATPITGEPHLLPATVEVREWDAMTEKPREERALLTKVKTAYSTGARGECGGKPETEARRPPLPASCCAVFRY
jgi:hypothetical protein